MMMRQKRVAAVHDISGIGKCSLTVALPIISAAGLECSVLPTAVLSTHTAGFTGFTYRDLTEDIGPITDHWRTLGLPFEAIYSGFLGSFEQIELVGKLFEAIKGRDTIVAVDPVMADNGKLYPIFPAKFPEAMLGLCQKADLIMPNFTEAAFMLGEEYVPGPYTKEYIEGLLDRLARATGAKQIVLTGVCFDDRELGAAAYEPAAGKLQYVMGERIEGSYHGTGDVFGSALVGALVNGKSLAGSVRIAVDFTIASLRWTKEAGTPWNFGVNFEANLPGYIRALGLM